MQIRPIIAVVALSLLILVACNKQEAASTPPATQAQPAVVAPPPPKILPDPASEIYLRPNWAQEAADPQLMRPLGPVIAITFIQLPAEVTYSGTSTTATVEYLERMRKTARANGLADIPYHFAVDRGGGVWQLRLMNFEGEIFPGKNSGNAGVLILGRPDVPMTDNQKLAAEHLVWVLWKRYQFPLKNVLARDELGAGGWAGPDVKQMIREIQRPR